MSNDPHAVNGVPRAAPSPSLTEAATGLLSFVAQPPSIGPFVLQTPATATAAAAPVSASILPLSSDLSLGMQDAIVSSAAQVAASAPTITEVNVTDGSTAAPAKSEAVKTEEDEDPPTAPPPAKRRTNLPVDHTYRDFATVSDAELKRLDRDFSFSMLNCPDLDDEKKKILEQLKDMPSKSSSSQSFPIRLHAVISNPELADVISWLPHGRCFIVHDPDALVEVLPRYFNQTKFLSFVRQLNLWGFKRLTREVRGKAYYHELFLRGRPYLALRLQRMKFKGNGGKPIPNPAGEPNFYSFSPLDGAASTAVVATKTSPSKHDGESRSKKQIMMGRAQSSAAEHPIQQVSSDVPGLTDSKPKATEIDPMTQNVAPVAQVPQPYHPLAALTGAGFAPNPASVAHLTAMMNVANIPRVPDYSMLQQPMDDLLRLAQLKREQDEINLNHQAKMYMSMYAHRNIGAPAVTMPSLQAMVHSNGPGINYPADASAYLTQASLTGAMAQRHGALQLSASESIREAQHLEELALAARARARSLALASVMDSPQYESVRNNDQGGDGSPRNGS